MVYIRKVVNKWERVEKELNRRSQPEKKGNNERNKSTYHEPHFCCG